MNRGRLFPTMTRLTLATLLLLILSLPTHADITGKPRVVDGDTIHIAQRPRAHRLQ